MPFIVAEMIVFASLTGAFMLLIVGMIAVLSIIRQQRHHRVYRAEMRALHTLDLTVALSQLTPVGTAETLVRRPRSLQARRTRNVIKVDIPEHYQLPVRPGDPDQVVIQIDPDSESPDQRNVQRLIDYLKSEMDRAHQAS